MICWKHISILSLGLALLAGCTTTETEVTAPPEPTPYDRANLTFESDGFVDSRSGWFFPQSLLDEWISPQAWEYDKTIVGIEYVKAGGLLDISTMPLPTEDSAIENGTVSIVAYPTSYAKEDTHPDSFLGSIPGLMGLGHQQRNGIEEFWAYQKQIEAGGYNLWKLVKLQQGDSPDRIFHSQLVLKKLSKDKSEGLIITVGPAADCYVVIVIRKYLRSKDDLDSFGKWSYEVLRELNLKALAS